MIRSFTGVDKMEKISPPELAVYLSRSGWIVKESNRSRVVYSLITADDHFEAIVSLDPEHPAYPMRVRGVLRILATIEGRTPEEIAQTIMYGSDAEWEKRLAHAEKLLPVIIRTVNRVTEGIVELEAEMTTPTTVTKMVSMARLLDQFVDHETALLIASYAILKAAGSTE